MINFRKIGAARGLPKSRRRDGGETRIQGFSGAKQNVKSVEFREARGDFFGLTFLLLFSSRKKVKKETKNYIFGILRLKPIWL